MFRMQESPEEFGLVYPRKIKFYMLVLIFRYFLKFKITNIPSEMQQFGSFNLMSKEMFQSFPKEKGAKLCYFIKGKKEESPKQLGCLLVQKVS